ncbi:restriction endonuclease [Haloarcula rubripromontorii]|uniref:restriction endonuclease n=1 Tax=Haloarcula rubripromontorii TaxID=1705562 RepID=UPI00345B9BB0
MAQSHEVLRNRLKKLFAPNEQEISDWGDYHDQLRSVAAEIPQILGYDIEHIHSDLTFQTPESVRHSLAWHYVDFPVVVAETESAPPYLTIVCDQGNTSAVHSHDKYELKDWEKLYLDGYAATSRSKYTILLTNAFIAVSSVEDGVEAHILSDLSSEQASNLIDKLSPPEDLPSGIGTHFPSGYHPDQTKLTRWLFADSDITPEYQRSIKTEFYKIDIDHYKDVLYEAYIAETNLKKGDSLQKVAELLFDGLKMVSIRDTELNTQSGEIDLVLEYEGHKKTNVFQYHSRFVLVECKNETRSVSSKEVGHFEKKLRKRQVDLGIIIAWNGISGESSGKYAQRYVEMPNPGDPIIIVLNSDDLYSILDGTSLYQIIDEKLYQTRFDL